jgi:hypothetical protein
MIETAVEIVRGVVPKPHSLRMHSEKFWFWNHPSRHCKERDDAALTQEGNSPGFSFTIILFAESILDSGGFDPSFPCILPAESPANPPQVMPAVAQCMVLDHEL